MPSVALRFTPLAEHVRTARLVAVSVARRAGFAEAQLDEIRIAVGEACARAVSEARDGLVDMHLSDDDDRLDVTVVACAADGTPLPVSGLGEDPLAVALLEGMAEAVTVQGQPVEVALDPAVPAPAVAGGGLSGSTAGDGAADGAHNGVRMAWSLSGGESVPAH